MEKTKNPPALATIGAILVVLALWAAQTGRGGIALLAGVLAVLCGILWATAAYIRRGD